MARSNKPLLWLPFAAGGMVAALVIPALIVVTGVLVPLGILHLPYDKAAAALKHPIAKVVVFGLVAFTAWHAAHRLRMTVHDLGLGQGFVVKAICYGGAAAVIITSAAALVMI